MNKRRIKRLVRNIIEDITIALALAPLVIGVPLFMFVCWLHFGY